MKILKRILIIIVIIIAIPLVMALFMKKSFFVEREVVINKPKQDVFNYVKMLKNQKNFNKWAMEDTNAIMTYKGADGTVGFFYAWDSKDKHVGVGEETITKMADGDRMDMALHFIRPMEGNDNAYIATEAVTPTQTKVKWGFYGEMKYPFNFMGLFMNNMLGKDLQTSLGNLKGILEK